MPELLRAYAVLVRLDGQEISERIPGTIEFFRTGPTLAEVAFVPDVRPMVLDVTAPGTAMVHYCRAADGSPIFRSEQHHLREGDKVSPAEAIIDASSELADPLYVLWCQGADAYAQYAEGTISEEAYNLLRETAIAATRAQVGSTDA